MGAPVRSAPVDFVAMPPRRKAPPRGAGGRSGAPAVPLDSQVTAEVDSGTSGDPQPVAGAAAALSAEG